MPAPKDGQVFAKVDFPASGLDLEVSYGTQRIGTTRVAKNVRLFEPSTDRARGGSRPGVMRFINQQLPLSSDVPDVPVVVGIYWGKDYWGADYFGPDYWG